MKNIVITGASHGMGLAMAKRMAKNNNILLVSRTETNLAEIKASLKKGPTKIDYCVADITKEPDREKIFTFAKKYFSPVDVLINNAGIYYKERVEKNENTKIDEIFNTNILALMKLTKLFAGEFIKNKRGQIINISSDAGLKGFEGDTVYCASKFAVTGFTQALFEELRKYGVRVSCIYPSFVNTWGAPQSNALLKPDDVAVVVEAIINLPDYAVVPDLRITAIDEYQQD